MTGKKIKNTGQRNRYYIKDSHPAIVSAEVFDKVQEEMEKRARFLSDEDGTLETRGNKYSGKYLLGNLLVCGHCGMSYRRRTERGKVLWRCATRIEKGKDRCFHSPTLNEEWIKMVIGKTICENRSYDEEIVRNSVEKILIFNDYVDICCNNEEKLSITFKYK